MAGKEAIHKGFTHPLDCPLETPQGPFTASPLATPVVTTSVPFPFSPGLSLLLLSGAPCEDSCYSTRRLMELEAHGSTPRPSFLVTDVNYRSFLSG